MKQRCEQTPDLASAFISTGGITVHYKCGGVGEPLLLLHGAGCDWREWRKNIDFLSQHFRLFIPDLPGYGKSQFPEPPVPLSWYGPFLNDFMETLAIDSAHVMGHSLGGLSSLLLALYFPSRVNKLVLIASAGIGEISLSGRVRLSLLKTLAGIAGNKKAPVYAPEPDGAWLIRDRLPEIRSPALVLWGSRDPYFPLSCAHTARDLIPTSNLHVFNRCAHAPQRERVEEFNSLVYDFLI